MLIRSAVKALAPVLLCLSLSVPAFPVSPAALLSAGTAVADDDGGGGDGGGWGPTISIGGRRGGCFGRLGLCLGGLGPIPGAALRPMPPAGPAPRVGPRGTWP